MLLTTIFSILPLAAFGADYCKDDIFCVFSKPLVDEIEFTIHSASEGWFGFGLGKNMASSSMFIAWTNSTNGVMLSPRESHGYALPIVSTNGESVKMIKLALEPPGWAKISVSFRRARNVEGSLSISAQSGYFYAFSARKPSSLDDRSSPFKMHDGFGFIDQVDFASDKGIPLESAHKAAMPTEAAPQKDFKQHIIVHGFVMIFTWFVFPLVGIFVARYLKNVLGHKWFIVHRAVMFAAFAISIISVQYLHSSRTEDDLDSAHEIIGLFVSFASFFQVMLGFVSDKLWSPKRTKIPSWDKQHWWLGRTLFALALCNIILGFQKFNEMYPLPLELPLTFAVFILISIGLFAYAEKQFGQVHHITAASATESEKSFKFTAIDDDDYTQA